MIMRTIAVCNLKGGVAKTTTIVNAAAILAKDYKQRVLVVDADSQCNTTEFFGVSGEVCPTLADLLRETRDGVNGAIEEYITETSFPGVSLIPADDSLMDLDLTKVETKSVEATVLRDVVSVLTEQDAYDWCLVDCPPAFNAASAAALIAADEVIIPIKLDPFAIRGLTNMLRQIANMRQINPRLKLGGVLPVKWYKSPHTEAWEMELKDSHLHVYDHIRRCDKVDDSMGAYLPLVNFSPRCGACTDYRRFVRRLVEGDEDNG